MNKPTPDLTRDSLAPVVPTVSVHDRKRNDAAFLELDDESLDPSRHYRWVRADKNNSSVVRHRLLGYELETTGGTVRTTATPDSRGDSAIAIGDVVLMSCPVESFEKRQLESFRRREEILVSTSAETEKRAKEKGIVLIHDEDHNKESR